MSKILKIILLSILLTVTFVIVRYSVWASVMSRANYGMRAAASMPRVSMLFMGSSMFRKGIYAPDFGLNAYLLAYNGNQPALEALQLQFMLEHGANIQQLVVDMYPYSAARSAALSDTRMLMDGGARFTQDLYDSLNDEEQRGVSAWYKMVVQSNNEQFVTMPLTYPLTNARYLRGANETDLAGCSAEWLDEAEAEEMKVNQDSLHDDQKRGLLQIIDLCQKNNIELVFLETPKYQKVYADSTFQHIMRSYMTFLEAQGQQMILTEATAALLVDHKLRPSLVTTYDYDYHKAAYYSDLIHLSSEGRRELSAKLKAILQNIEQ